MTYDELVEKEGGYYLFWNAYTTPDDVYYIPHCGYCSDALEDMGDMQYMHSSESTGRECWDRRQARAA